MQKYLENYFSSLAKIATNGKKTLILCDRGCLDSRAYVGPQLWSAILDETNWNVVNLAHKRYNAVIHMVTAADGAAEFYQNENNKTRYENVAQAVEIDRKIQESYTGHPDHRIIRNMFKKRFEYKINRMIEEISNIIGLTDASSA